jgi:ADP-ribose pyrophosphatase YjhB (NUDIX family)
MHKIYLEKRCIVICSPEEPALSDPNSVELHLGETPDIASIVDMFETSAYLSRVYIPTADIEGTYRRFCAQFKEVNAAGGLVSNRRGDVLLIRRNDLWDLPKGHQEAGEDISVTALREVQEETGVLNLELRELICVTDHCYRRNDIWHLKHTWWFDMLYTDPVDLTPQREEDITKAAWVARSGLSPYLKNTYPSIAEVFREDRG